MEISPLLMKSEMAFPTLSRSFPCGIANLLQS
jgi:hypothetical protein